jgi:hypothetical protein
MKVKQVDVMQRVIRLDPGTTKNSDGREVFMTDGLYLLLGECVEGKGPENAVFTRSNRGRSGPCTSFACLNISGKVD